jgi:peptidoglycan/LPS O-acetylase OafA/YrhL
VMFAVRFIQRVSDTLGKGPIVGQLTSNRDNNFDALRLVGAILVIFAHSFAIVGLPNMMPPFYTYHYGVLGVDIFFIISGFLITQSYLRSNNPGRFIWSRFIRIFPALILVTLTLVFVLGPLLTTLSNEEYFTHPWTYSYLRGALSLYEVTRYTVLPGVFMDNVYVQMNGPLWTLQYEWTFYLVVLILGLTTFLKKKGLVTSLFVISLVLASFNISGDANIYWTPICWLPIFFMYFCFGSLACLYQDQIRLTWGMLLLVVTVLVLASLKGGLTDAIFVFCLGYLVLFLGLSPQIRLSWLTRSGDYSYGLYIWGWPVQQTVFHFLGRGVNVWIEFVISLCLALVMAALSWHLLEKRVLKLKNAHFDILRKKHTLL